jgi:carboxypeptidase T
MNLKIFFSISIFFLVCSSRMNAQTYSRVKILADNEGLRKISAAGVCVDHGEHKFNTSLITEIAENEISLIRSLGYEVEVLVKDLGAFYSLQNPQSEKNGIPPNSVLADDCSGNCAAWPQPQNFALGSFAGFFTYQEVLDNLDSMAAKFPGIISVKQSIGTGTTVEGRTIYYVKISDNPSVNENEPEILYNSLHHAREAASISQLIYFMWYMLEHYGSDPAINYLVNNTEMYFVPVVNPDGYLYNYSTNPNGGGMWRKNRRNNGDGTFGIDLNRNYDYEWGYDNIGSSPTSGSDTYRGPSAASEPETQLMKSFINANQFKISVNNHTYSDLLIYPFGYVADFLTPDSTQFSNYAELLTSCSGFGYGTPNQTVGYTGNGTIDDWLYADTAARAKILSFTPEAGASTDGFWPAQSRIVPICQNTMGQNMYAAKLVGQFAQVKSTDGMFNASISFYTHFNFTRLGMEPGNFTVGVTPLTANVSSVGAAVSFTNPALLQTYADSVLVNLNAPNPGDLVAFLLFCDNGFYQETDTVSFYFGSPVIAFTDNCNSVSPEWTSSSWGVSTSQFVSASGSLTESTTGNYPNNSTRTITTTNYIDLTDALAARLSFNAKWTIEANYDYVQVQASTDGVNWTPLCGRYTTSGSSYQDPGNPVYDGFQSQWVKEEIDLSDYDGSSIKLRFRLKSDGGLSYDGFYFDDALVEKIVSVSAGENGVGNNFSVNVFPNPASDKITISCSQPGAKKYCVTDLSGRRILEGSLNSVSETVSVSSLDHGVYLLNICVDEKVISAQKIIVTKTAQ